VGRYALLWSGGKDSALALVRARQAGLEVARLVTFYDAASGRVRFHGTRVELIRAQAAAAGIQLVALGTAWEEMDRELRRELARLRAEGFLGVVGGDIHLADVRAWYGERIGALGLEHVEPLWGEQPAALLEEFVAGGGRAVVTCVELARMGPEWLGRQLDGRFLEEVSALGIDPCGELGEYHTFCFGGPAFEWEVGWRAGVRREEGRFCQLDLVPGLGSGDRPR
jgi:uncharacterized protein (TIGR00290 family)